MAQQVEDWSLNVRIEMDRKRNSSGSTSFNTLLSSSTDSSSNLDTQSTGITLGRLIGVSSILELSRTRRSLRRAETEVLKSKKGKKSNFVSWLLLCLCSRSINLDAENNPPSLGHLLALERRAANENRENQINVIYGPDDEFPLTQIIRETNSLFLNAPSWSISSRQGALGHREKAGHQGKATFWFGSFQDMFSCLCRQASPG